MDGLCCVRCEGGATSVCAALIVLSSKSYRGPHASLLNLKERRRRLQYIHVSSHLPYQSLDLHTR